LIWIYFGWYAPVFNALEIIRTSDESKDLLFGHPLEWVVIVIFTE
jgi:hypothetical protein